MKTKNAILYIFIYLSINLLYGQEIIKRQTFSSNLDAFSGTWEYASENEVLKITLKKGSVDTNTSFGSCIIGDYFYSKNNIILDNYSISNIPSIYNDLTRNTIIIFASNAKLVSVNYVNPNELYLYFYDKQKRKRVYSGKIQLISPTQIRWLLEDDEGDYDEENWVEPGFSVPTNVVMTKTGNINSTPEEL